MIGVNPHAGIAVYVGGLLGSVYSLLQLACSPLAGWAADRIGRRPVAVLSSVRGLSSRYRSMVLHSK